MLQYLLIAFGLLTILHCIGCANVLYERTQVGKFEGSLDVRWIKPDRFIYIPDKDDPLRFSTSDKKRIEPGRMFTDGGSIPRLFWSVPGYSPWGYAPSYIIHDWLFEAHHCNISEYKDISFDDSARLLAEGIKTLMEMERPRETKQLSGQYMRLSSLRLLSLFGMPQTHAIPLRRPCFLVKLRNYPGS